MFESLVRRILVPFTCSKPYRGRARRRDRFRSQFAPYRHVESLEARWYLTSDPIVTIDTNFGNFQLDLFASTAPKTVANFLTYVDSGAYNNSIIQRNVPNFVIQGGGFTTTSSTFTSGSQLTAIASHGTVLGEPGTKNTTGTIAMALSSGPNSGTNEWFINMANNPQLDDTSDGGPFTVFGQVVGNGMTSVINPMVAQLSATNLGYPSENPPVAAGNKLVVISSMSVDSIDGTVFGDTNGNGTMDSGETGIAGRTVFINKDGTGVPDSNNPSTTTDANGNFTFSGLAPGTYTVEEVLPSGVRLSTPARSVTVAADQTASGVTFGETTFTGHGVTFAATEGQSFTQLLATFSDQITSDTASQFSASINWGDGVTSLGTVTGSAGAFTVQGIHTYAEDGALPVEVTLSTTGTSTASFTAASTADVISAGLTVSASSLAPTEGTTFTGNVATFTGPGTGDTASQFAATINWGDGTSSTGTVTGSSGTFTVADSHTYEIEGNVTISVQVADTKSVPAVTASSTAAVTVADANVLTGFGRTFSAASGATFSGTVATFSDVVSAASPSGFTATINWGDGSSSTGTVGGTGAALTVSGSHVYATTGTDTVTVKLADKTPGTVTATATSTAQVANVTLSATGVNVNVTQGTTASNVTVATFTDSVATEPASNFTATIKWGDGTSSTGSVTGGNGSFTVTGSHTYSDPTKQTLSVSIADSNGASATASSTATVGSADQRYTAQLYRDLLGREGESLGMSYWTNRLNQGDSRLTIAMGFTESLEFRDDVTQQLYQLYLHRPADSAALSSTATALLTGSPEQQAETIVSSAEFFNDAGGTANGFLTALYTDALNRPIDAASQTKFGALNLTDPSVRSQVAAQVFGSTEFQTDLLNVPSSTSARLTDHTGLTDGFYQIFLHRPADSNGLAASLAQFKAGQNDFQVQQTILASDEYFARL
jgi:cyclophilin family peptidyl-prolyl cis-trans isomerase